MSSMRSESHLGRDASDVRRAQQLQHRCSNFELFQVASDISLAWCLAARSTKIGQNFSLHGKMMLLTYLIFSNNITFRLLLPDDDNLVAGEDELGNDGGEPPHEVATTINHDRLRRYSRHLLQEFLGLDNQLSSIRRNLTCEHIKCNSRLKFIQKELLLNCSSSLASSVFS